MSALPPNADMCGVARDVRFRPKADIQPSRYAQGAAGHCLAKMHANAITDNVSGLIIHYSKVLVPALRTGHRIVSNECTGRGHTKDSRCPLWVKSRHFTSQAPCPLYPRSGHHALLPRIAQAYAAKYPDVSLELILTNRIVCTNSITILGLSKHGGEYG